MGRAMYRLRHTGLVRNIAAIMIKGFLGLTAANVLSSPVLGAEEAHVPAAELSGANAMASVRRAQFLGRAAPGAVRQMADWVVDDGDNGRVPFVIVDKPDAKVFVFDQNGKLLGGAWALVGLARGDDSVPGIGTMPLTSITPEMRTTPAGRFVAALGHDLGKSDVLWVDYTDAISLHRVINTKPSERRLVRIVSRTPAEHRISYGCINVPAKFFDSVVDPTFQGIKGVVYILPEVKSLRAVFPAYYEVNSGGGLQAATGTAHAVNSPPIGETAASVENHDLPGIVHGPGLKPAEKTLTQQ